MDCRVGCAACCIDISISSPIPGMPQGKPANVRCVQLAEDNRCKLFGKPERPGICLQFKPCLEICGQSNDEAYYNIRKLEASTKP